MRRLTTITPIADGFERRTYEIFHVSAASRLDDPKSVSSANPPSRISRSRHRCGTDPRVCHCSRAYSPTPKDLAAASIDFQSSEVPMTSPHKDNLSASQGQIGWRPQLVDCLAFDMTSKQEKQETEKAFQLRIKAQAAHLRESRGLSQPEFAKMIGESKGNYQKYETIPSDNAKAKWRKMPTTTMLRIILVFDLDYELFMTGFKRDRSKVGAPKGRNKRRPQLTARAGLK